MSLKSPSHWRPHICYPSMYSDIVLSEPSEYESNSLADWKPAFDFLTTRLKTLFRLHDLELVIDANMIWVISDISIPEYGDIERDQGHHLLCNKLSIIKQLCKLYKPSLWNNMGIGFITRKEYTYLDIVPSFNSSKLSVESNLTDEFSTPLKGIHTHKSRSTTSPRLKEPHDTSRRSPLFSSFSVGPNHKKRNREDFNPMMDEYPVNEDSKSESTSEKRGKKKKNKYYETIEITRHSMSDEALQFLREPPPSIWKRGKRSADERDKIQLWEQELKDLGYDPVEYKRYVVELNKSKENLENEVADTKSSLTQLTQLALVDLNEAEQRQSITTPVEEQKNESNGTDSNETDSNVIATTPSLPQEVTDSETVEKPTIASSPEASGAQEIDEIAATSLLFRMRN